MMATKGEGCARCGTYPTISRHELTTAMQPLSLRPLRGTPLSESSTGWQSLGWVCAVRRIKPHAPPLVRAPVNSFEFQPCGRTPQAERLMRWLRHPRGRCLERLALIVYGVDY